MRTDLLFPLLLRPILRTVVNSPILFSLRLQVVKGSEAVGSALKVEFTAPRHCSSSQVSRWGSVRMFTIYHGHQSYTGAYCTMS